MKLICKNILFIILLVTVSVIYPSNSYALSVLSESFDDGNTNDGVPLDWIEYKGIFGNWIVSNGSYLGSSPRNNNIHSMSVAGDTVWENFIAEIDITGVSGVDRHFLFRYDPSRQAPFGYAVKYREENFGFTGHIELQRAGQTVVSINNSFKSHIGESHHLKVIALENKIKVYMDNLLVIDFEDSNPINNGKFVLFIEKPGFFASGFDGITRTSYDNFFVKPLDLPIGPFELPFEYDGRLDDNAEKFKLAFWNRLSSSFDHLFDTKIYQPFTGNLYSRKDCPNGVIGIECYDSHNGTDFTKLEDQDVYSLASGQVIYISDQEGEKDCKKQSGFGCVVLVEYPNNLVALFAHLSKIKVALQQEITAETAIGEVGNTGCSPCGKHIHLGILKPIINQAQLSVKMSKNEWETFLETLPTDNDKEKTKDDKKNVKEDKSFCTYRAPNGLRFAFIDPSGWAGDGIDPWTLPLEDEQGCEIESPYLWKFDVGTSPST